MNFRTLPLACFLAIALSSPIQADVITDWNDQVLDIFAAQGQTATPPDNSRTLGMVHAAVFDAVNSIDRSYSAYLNYYDPGGSASAEAAAAQAARDTLVSILGSGSPFVSSIDSLLQTHLSAIPDGPEKTNGISLGQAAALGMINSRAGDGSAVTTSTYTTQPANTPGAWQPGNNVGAWGASAGSFLKSEWGYVTPFTLSSGSQFRAVAPPTLSSAEYTAAFNQVKALGNATSSTRTAEQTNIAYFWVDGPGTSSPPGHWNRIAQTISASQGLSLQDNARLFALLNLAEADVGIATWDTKRAYDLWRPMQAIAQADIDGNPDTIQDSLWSPLIPTPSFPAYTSGHSAFSMAGATILAQFFGTDDIAFTTGSESPFLSPGYERSFDSFSQAAEEAGMSRIYGGIHWSFDNEAGAELGANVGNWVFSNYLTPVPEPANLILLGVSGCLLTWRRRR